MHEIIESCSVTNITFNIILLIEAMQIISTGVNTSNEFIWTDDFIKSALSPFEYIQVTLYRKIRYFKKYL